MRAVSIIYHDNCVETEIITVNNTANEVSVAVNTVKYEINVFNCVVKNTGIISTILNFFYIISSVIYYIQLSFKLDVVHVAIISV